MLNRDGLRKPKLKEGKKRGMINRGGWKNSKAIDSSKFPHRDRQGIYLFEKTGKRKNQGLIGRQKK